jgi:hypothetical protein
LVECLPSKHEALSSNLNTTKKRGQVSNTLRMPVMWASAQVLIYAEQLFVLWLLWLHPTWQEQGVCHLASSFIPLCYCLATRGHGFWLEQVVVTKWLSCFSRVDGVDCKLSNSMS